MIAILFLLLVFVHGFVLTNKILDKANSATKLTGGFIFGSILSVSFVYWTACIFKTLNISLLLFFFISSIIIFTFRKNYTQNVKFLRFIPKTYYFIFILLLLFSFYLFGKTFGYDDIHSTFLIASNVYMDFGAHIPFIRSFSMGSNFPGEIPFFQNTGLLYYFMFDFYTGILEKLGMRIDIAYNLLSAISFTFLLILIYELAIKLFKQKIIGALSVVFFLFSSNLSFLTFFQKYGFHISTVSEWWHNNFYLEGQPTLLNKSIEIAQSWNLNPFMNQRHFVFGASFFVLFLLLWLILADSKRKSVFIPISLGIILGLLPMWHTMIFLAVLMIYPFLLLFYKQVRKQLLITCIIACLFALPQLLLIKIHSANTILFVPGFLLEHRVTFFNELLFWFVNLGLSIFTVTLGFVMVPKENKKFFIILLPLFLIPNFVHLSSRMIFDDHKYFNLWIIGANMFSAYFVVKLLNRNILTKLVSIFLTVFLTVSGIISIMVIKNDIYTPIPDYKGNTFLSYVLKIIPNNAIVMTNGEIYDPITLIGKKTIIGRVQYIYTYGGDASSRIQLQQSLLQPISSADMIQMARKSNVAFLILYKNNFAKNEKAFDKRYYKNFVKLYEDNNGIVYKI